MTGWVPDACTLPTVEQPLRVKEFADLFAADLLVSTRISPTELRLELRAGCADRVRDLVAREAECCSFFAFAVHEKTDRVVLDIAVPDAHRRVLDAIARR